MLEELETMVHQMAEICCSQHLPVGMVYGDETHLWLRTYVTYRPETEFYLFFLLTCEMGKIYKACNEIPALSAPLVLKQLALAI